ncbi:MAG: ACP phosphodiesterase, partial [Bacteroidota bacterium]
MNYLAHLALSGKNEEIIIGNYIGDSLKGIQIENFPIQIQKGIKLHRLIDVFTDRHPEFLSAKRIFTPDFHKFSGVLVDIFFDHFLAVNFNKFHSIELQLFASECYDVIQKNYSLLPDNAKRFYHYMVDKNILFEYKNTNSIKMVLEGIYHRINFLIPVVDSHQVF